MVKKLNPELQEQIENQQNLLFKGGLVRGLDKKLDQKLKSLKRKMMARYSSEQVELLNESLFIDLNKKIGRVSKRQLEEKKIENLNKSI